MRRERMSKWGEKEKEREYRDRKERGKDKI
jgi:hypothetical protein